MIRHMTDENRHDDESVAESAPTNWRRRIILVLIAVPTLIVLFLLGASFLPRWWAHRVGAQANGTFSSGIWWGLIYGLVFTLLPLVALRQVLRRRWQWKTRVGIVVAAMLLATPNLLTLGIVLGSGKAAHAGERTLDTDAPGFRGATLAGVLIALALGITTQWLWTSRRRRGREVKELRGRLRENDEGS